MLLVEDNPDDEQLVRRVVRRHDVNVRLSHAKDGREFVDLVVDALARRAPEALPDLVLLDLKMPRMDGFAALREVRSDPRTRPVNVVVFTSSAQQEDVLRAYRLGAHGYVNKPIDYDQYTQALLRLFEYWLGLNRSPPRVVEDDADSRFAY